MLHFLAILKMNSCELVLFFIIFVPIIAYL